MYGVRTPCLMVLQTVPGCCAVAVVGRMCLSQQTNDQDWCDLVDKPRGGDGMCQRREW